MQKIRLHLPIYLINANLVIHKIVENILEDAIFEGTKKKEFDCSTNIMFLHYGRYIFSKKTTFKIYEQIKNIKHCVFAYFFSIMCGYIIHKMTLL